MNHAMFRLTAFISALLIAAVTQTAEATPEAAATIGCTVLNEGYVSGQPLWILVNPASLPAQSGYERTLLNHPQLALTLAAAEVVTLENARPQLQSYQLRISQPDQAEITLRSAPLSAGGTLHTSLKQADKTLTIECLTLDR